MSDYFDGCTKNIATILQQCVGEENDELTRLTVLSRLEHYLGWERAVRNITDFRVVCDETNNNSDDSTLVADVELKTTLAGFDYQVFTFMISTAVPDPDYLAITRDSAINNGSTA